MAPGGTPGTDAATEIPGSFGADVARSTGTDRPRLDVRARFAVGCSTAPGLRRRASCVSARAYVAFGAGTLVGIGASAVAATLIAGVLVPAVAAAVVVGAVVAADVWAGADVDSIGAGACVAGMLVGALVAGAVAGALVDGPAAPSVVGTPSAAGAVGASAAVVVGASPVVVVGTPSATGSDDSSAAVVLGTPSATGISGACVPGASVISSGPSLMRCSWSSKNCVTDMPSFDTPLPPSLLVGT